MEKVHDEPHTENEESLQESDEEEKIADDEAVGTTNDDQSTATLPAEELQRGSDKDSATEAEPDNSPETPLASPQDASNDAEHGETPNAVSIEQEGHSQESGNLNKSENVG